MPGLATIQNDVPYTQEFIFRNEEGCEAVERWERAVWVNVTATSYALSFLNRGYSFTSYIYDNNQQLTHKAAHPFLTFNLQCWWAASEYHSFNFHMNIQTLDWAVLCETRHQDGLMGLEIYAGTIWAALAFKLQSSGEMGNDNCIKIKRNLQLTITVRNWPRVWALTSRCCTVGSPAVIRMWEQAVPTHWVHQAVSNMIRVDNDNRKMKRWREKSANV